MAVYSKYYIIVGPWYEKAACVRVNLGGVGVFNKSFLPLF